MTTLRRGAHGPDVELLQSFLALDGDGRYGPATEAAVRAFQRDHGLVVDGVAGPKTWLKIVARKGGAIEDATSRFLSESDLVACARDLDVDVAAIKALSEVESAGCGFLGGRPKILFEGHVFYRRLKAWGIAPTEHRQGNEDIIFPKRDPSSYRGGLAEWPRLQRARAIHHDAADESASWGAFQIMGFNFEACGFGSVGSFVDAMSRHERDHLAAFAMFLSSANLVEAVRRRDWLTVARGYNGPAQQGYDKRLPAAYARHSRA